MVHVGRAARIQCDVGLRAFCAYVQLECGDQVDLLVFAGETFASAGTTTGEDFNLKNLNVWLHTGYIPPGCLVSDVMELEAEPAIQWNHMV